MAVTREIADYFERAALACGDAKQAANWVMGDLAGMLKADGKEMAESPISAEHLGELIALIIKGELSGKLAKDIFPKMYATGDAPGVIMVGKV